MGEIHRDQRRVLQEQEHGLTASACALRLGDDSRLRLLDEGDADELQALIEANREGLTPWLPWAAGQRREDTLAFVRRSREQVEANEGFQAAVVVGDRIAGVVGYVGLDWENRATRIGYWLGEEFRGRGTMTAAVRALVAHAFSVWDLQRVEIRVAPENLASRAIPERLGFREEGTARRAQRVGSHYLDSVVYAKLSADWT